MVGRKRSKKERNLVGKRNFGERRMCKEEKILGGKKWGRGGI
jgi:hypothetical protein